MINQLIYKEPIKRAKKEEFTFQIKLISFGWIGYIAVASKWQFRFDCVPYIR